jgi:MFS family permease
MGAFNFAGSLGYAIGPMVGGWIYLVRGYSDAFLLSGVMEIALALVAVLVIRHWGAEATPTR